MEKVILDADLRAKLRGGQTWVEVHDEAGNVVGHYLPRDEYLRLVYAVEKAAVSDEELAEARRDIRENGGVTTAEILARLDQVRRDLEGRR